MTGEPKLRTHCQCQVVQVPAAASMPSCLLSAKHTAIETSSGWLQFGRVEAQGQVLAFDSALNTGRSPFGLACQTCWFSDIDDINLLNTSSAVSTNGSAIASAVLTTVITCRVLSY